MRARPDTTRRRGSALLDTARLLIAARGLLAKRDRRRLRAIRQKITLKNRFDSRDGADVSPEAKAFGAAMRKYLAGRSSWTCGEVIDVLMGLGYVNAERDFEVCVHRFTVALDYFKRGGRKKKNRRPFPTWSEVLQVAARVGWHLP